MQKSETLGSLWELTREAVLNAQKITKKELEIKNEKIIDKDQLKVSFNFVNNEKDEIKELLDKAGIKASVYFPFKTRTNGKGELEIIPKNIFKMKKDSKKAKEQLQEALENNKITLEEFNMLKDNLKEMLKENGLDEEKEEQEDIVVTEQEIEELYQTFNEGIEENMEGLIASIGEKSFVKMCEEYEEMDVEERKYRLEDFNSRINKKLGIAGKLEFVNNQNLSFEDSFIKGGYLLSEKDVETKNLQDIAKSMLEKSMVRKMMVSKNSNLTAEQKQALYNKIVEQKRLQQQMQQKQTQTMSRKYTG